MDLKYFVRTEQYDRAKYFKPIRQVAAQYTLLRSDNSIFVETLKCRTDLRLTNVIRDFEKNYLGIFYQKVCPVTCFDKSSSIAEMAA